MAAAVMCAAGAQPGAVSTVVAEVGNEAITSIELERVLKPYIEQLQTRVTREELEQELPRLRYEALKQLVDRKLLTAAAKEQELTMPEIEVNKKLDEYKSRYATEEDFRVFLDQQGMTLEELRRTINDDLVVKVLFHEKVARRVRVLPTELHDYYQLHVDEFMQPAQVHMYQIMVRKRPDPAAAAAKAQTILAELKRGANFQQLARQYSDDPKRSQGGDWGLVSEGYFGDEMAAVEKAAFALVPGKFSPVVESRYGYHIVYIDRKRASHILTESEAYDEIYAKLFNQKLATVYEDYMQHLRDKHYVKIYLEQPAKSSPSPQDE
jgi:parvulin-like peptidyl-prolyl isomerase